MSTMIDTLTPSKSRLRALKLANIREDLSLIKSDKLDLRSLFEGYRNQRNPVGIEVRSADGTIKQRCYTHNLRTTAGINFQADAMASNVATAGAFTAATATTGTTNQNFANTTAYVGHLIVAQPASGNLVFGVITSHTSGAASVVTVDKWYDPTTITGVTSTSANPTAGTTPSATSNFVILTGRAPTLYVAFSTNSGLTPAAGDTTLNAETAATGLARIQAVYTHTLAATSYTYTKTVTNTSGGLITLYGAGIFDAASNGTLVFENTFVSAALQASDQLSITWTINI